MANGYFNLSLRNAGGLRDEDFLRAKQERRIDELLDDLGEEQQAAGMSNIVNGWFAFYMWYWCFAGCAVQTINTSDCQSGGNNGFYQTGGSGPCLFARIDLLDTLRASILYPNRNLNFPFLSDCEHLIPFR